jgi:hypothetical protein
MKMRLRFKERWKKRTRRQYDDKKRKEDEDRKRKLLDVASTPMCSDSLYLETRSCW